MLKESVNSHNISNSLYRNAEAIEALTKARALPNTVKKQLGVTDEILSELRASAKGDFSYKMLVDKITTIGKKLEANPNTKLEGFYDNVLYKLNKKSVATTNQKIGAEGVLKTVDDHFDDLLKDRKVTFENAVDNLRGTKSYEDINVEISTFDGADIEFRIEVKNCSNCVTSKVIKTQFIERDLYNATDISQIKWKIYGQNFTKADFEKYLKENREVIEKMFKKGKSLPEFNGEKIKNIDELIKKLLDDEVYNKIFI